jgi:DNA polymerase
VDASVFVPADRSLDALAQAAAGCRGCELYEQATQTVFGAGPSSASVVMVGEQPGDVEDRRGEAFVGPAGKLLDRVLDQAGIVRTDVYLTNAVKHFYHRPTGKRRLHQTPKAGHITACRPWLGAEVSTVQPKLIVCMGATAARSAIGPKIKVTQDRGRIIETEGLVGPGAYLVTIHPSAVLRAPDDQRGAFFDGMVADLRVAADFVAGG